MTDGIVQEVFKEHLHIQDGNEKNCNRCNLLNLIQQELIEKIKQLNTDMTKYGFIRITELIGDNNE